MLRILTFAALTALSSLAAPVAAQEQAAVAPAADGLELVIPLLKDFDQAFGAREARIAHFSSLAGPPVVENDRFTTMRGKVSALERIDLSNFDGLEQTTISFRFGGQPEANAFRQKLAAALGNPEPACSDDMTAH